MARKPAGWKVEATPPPPVRRTGRKSDQEAAQVIREALRSGQWLSKSYADMADALRALRRLRYHAQTMIPPARVQSRRTTDGNGVKLSVRVTQEGSDRD